jgi:hypothetical protein
MVVNDRRFSNTAVNTTLTSAITSASTSLVVGAATNYPDPPFAISLESELILVGGKSGNTFNTLTRGYDNTVAVSHSSGKTVAHKAVADDFEHRWVDAITDRPYGAYDDEFMDNTTDTVWEEVTPSGTAVWTEYGGLMSCRFGSQDSNDCAGLIRTIGAWAPPIYIHTAVRTMSMNTNYHMAGLLFSDGNTTSSNVVWVMPYTDSTNYYETLSLRSGTFANISTSAYTVSARTGGHGWMHQRLDWVNSNTWKAWYSPDGISWHSAGQVNQSITMTPTHFGVGVSSWGDTSVARIASFEFVRAYESKPAHWEDGT